MARKRFMNLGIFTIIALVIGLVFILLVIGSLRMVEDWSRDLTTNWAATHPDHSDTRLRPYECPGTPQQLADRLQQNVNTMPRWKWIAERREGEEIVVELTRSTPLFRFVDDVRVRIEPIAGAARAGEEQAKEPARVRLVAESRSRVGRGDLGQNPRNLRELLDSLRADPSH